MFLSISTKWMLFSVILALSREGKVSRHNFHLKCPSVFSFVTASLNLSASIIYYGLEGVILWGSITVQSVP